MPVNEITSDNVTCPICKHDHDECYDFVTYWGEDGPQKLECENCGTALTVQEEVVRRFIVKVAD
jgi:Zn ribbon nucleic-acid-binding protein